MNCRFFEFGSKYRLGRILRRRLGQFVAQPTEKAMYIIKNGYMSQLTNILRTIHEIIINRKL